MMRDGDFHLYKNGRLIPAVKALFALKAKEEGALMDEVGDIEFLQEEMLREGAILLRAFKGRRQICASRIDTDDFAKKTYPQIVEHFVSDVIFRIPTNIYQALMIQRSANA